MQHNASTCLKMNRIVTYATQARGYFPQGSSAITSTPLEQIEEMYWRNLTMMKIRRYLRGSGRVLAFVFVASIIWLIFDMAALRMSINDVNSQLLKERVIREREVFKQQSKMSQVIKNGFGHPVQRVNADGSQVNNEPLKVHRVAENVYRGRKRGPFVGDKKMDSNQVVLPALDDTKAKRQTEKPSKMRVDLDINEKNQFDSKLKTTTKMAAVKSINKGDNVLPSSSFFNERRLC
uniref:Uncharacterized protein n=1 Tax=Knipowitschia caucasica TaxID=637954 RepID=A0AAV2K3U9_KNICA